MKVSYLTLCSRGLGNPAFILFSALCISRPTYILWKRGQEVGHPIPKRLADLLVFSRSALLCSSSLSNIRCVLRDFKLGRSLTLVLLSAILPYVSPNTIHQKVWIQFCPVFFENGSYNFCYNLRYNFCFNLRNNFCYNLFCL